MEKNGMKLQRESSNAAMDKEEEEQLQKLKLVLLSAWDGLDLMELMSEDSQGKALDIVNPVTKAYYHFSRWCESVATHPSFDPFITGIILLAGVQVGLGTYPGTSYTDCQNDGCKDWTLPTILMVSENIILVSFVVFCGLYQNQPPLLFPPSLYVDEHTHIHMICEGTPIN